MKLTKWGKLFWLLIAILFLLIVTVNLVSAGTEYKIYISTMINNFEQARLPEYADEVSISGYLLNADSHVPAENKILRLAEVYRNPAGDVFILDMAWSPGTLSGENGYFEFLDVKQLQIMKNPAEFVIVIQDGEHTLEVIQQGNHPHDAGVWVVSLSSAISTGFIYTSMEESAGINGMAMEIK